MKIEPIQKQNISRQIVSQLCRRIFNGDILPGEKLPAERQLACDFGTNRNTLREALKTLEGIKLIQIRQGDGIIVRNFRAESELNLLPYFLLENELSGEKLELLQDVLYFKRIFLGEAAGIAAKKRDIASVQKLRQTLSQIKQKQEDVEALKIIDLEFFRSIISATGSLLLNLMFNTFENTYSKAISTFPFIWVRHKNQVGELDALIRAIEAGRVEDARKRMIRYFSEIDERIIEKILTLTGWGQSG